VGLTVKDFSEFFRACDVESKATILEHKRLCKPHAVQGDDASHAASRSVLRSKTLGFLDFEIL
jgi:hypothetical protein